jgi:hypothetical protein
MPAWNFMFFTWGSDEQQNTSTWNPPKISDLGELDIYRRNSNKSFRWNAETLSMVVHAHTQQTQQTQQTQKADVASLHAEICQYVKKTVVSNAMALCKERALSDCGISEREFNAIAPSIEEQVTRDFDSMSYRWIRMPTIRAVQTKLGQCAYLAANHDALDGSDVGGGKHRVSEALRMVWSEANNTKNAKSRRWFQWI